MYRKITSWTKRTRIIGEHFHPRKMGFYMRRIAELDWSIYTIIILKKKFEKFWFSQFFDFLCKKTFLEYFVWRADKGRRRWFSTSNAMSDISEYLQRFRRNHDRPCKGTNVKNIFWPNIFWKNFGKLSDKSTTFSSKMPSFRKFLKSYIFNSFEPTFLSDFLKHQIF